MSLFMKRLSGQLVGAGRNRRKSLPVHSLLNRHCSKTPNDGALQMLCKCKWKQEGEVNDVGLEAMGCMTMAADNWIRRAGVQFWYQPHFEVQ